MQTIAIKNILPDTDWMETEEGNAVYEKILPLIESGEDVNLSFEGGTLVLTPFLNGAVGQLYRFFPREYIRTHLHLSNADPIFDIEDKWQRVEVNSINYYKSRNMLEYDAIVAKEIES